MLTITQVVMFSHYMKVQSESLSSVGQLEDGDETADDRARARLRKDGFMHVVDATANDSKELDTLISRLDGKG